MCVCVCVCVCVCACVCACVRACVRAFIHVLSSFGEYIFHFLYPPVLKRLVPFTSMNTVFVSLTIERSRLNELPLIWTECLGFSLFENCCFASRRLTWGGFAARVIG